MAQKQSEQSKKSVRIVILVILTAITAAAVFILVYRFGGNSSKGSRDTAETQAPTEFAITACTEDEAAVFSSALVGEWQSYSDKGVAFTYTFDKDGTVTYREDGKDAEAYTYTFKDGFLNVSNSEKTHVYQCSRDAVGMMARLHNGEWQNYFYLVSEKIPNFGGCVYIDDGILYLAETCLCSADSLDSYTGKSLKGKWIGVIGDVLDFSDDGTYQYIQNAVEYNGAYRVDFDKLSLDITINGKTNPHDQDQWGLSGRVLHIGKQYYFKLTE